MSNAIDTVIAYSQVKHAALYFPYVVPLPIFIIEDLIIEAALEYQQKGVLVSDFRRKLEIELPDKETRWRRLLPPRLASDGKFFRLLQKFTVWDATHSALTQMIEVFGPADDFAEKKAELEAAMKKHLRVKFFHEQSLEKTFDHLVSHYKLHQFQALIPEAWDTLDANTEPESDDFRISLINMQLVDPSVATWDQICSFREDAASAKKLERLRRFFVKNYSGWPKNAVEDDLQTRLDDHAAVVRKFGFQVRQTKLEAVCSSKSLFGGLTGALAAALLGQPLTAALSGGTGLLLDLGNAALKIRQQKFEFNEFIDQHPLGYIISANETLAAKMQA